MATKNPKPRQPLTGIDACLAMHTALRKCCEGPATSALYNLIHLLNDIKPEKFHAWRLYGKLVAERLENKVANGHLLKDVYDDLEDAYYEVLKKDRASEPEHAKEALYAIKGMMGCFTDDDWERMASFLE